MSDSKKTTKDSVKPEVSVDSAKNSVQPEALETAEAKTETKEEQKQTEQKDISVKLGSLFAYKVGMTNVYEKNQMIPVTVLKYETARVTQIKTKEKEGYTAVQVALESSKKAGKAMKSHLNKAGFKNKALYMREVRGALPEGVQVGQEVSIESMQKGDKIFVSGISKGHGFAGVVKRWGFGGGPAAHGAEKHRTTGSIANTATQGRVFPGKKMPGHFGCDRITQTSRIVDVLPAKGAILVQGPVPGAKNSLIEIRKQEAVQ
ncbi:MAG: 50S ribosomal protein L3 [Bdellovibrionales bacterium]|nr:50S ribosomal protein L3 [Bdellovibrionales bacterium]